MIVCKRKLKINVYKLLVLDRNTLYPYNCAKNNYHGTFKKINK